MTRIEETIDVGVPLHTAYNQWTQFEQFPRFMEGIKQVQQVDDAHLHWVADIDGQTVEWDSELVQQVPDQVIAWHTTTGAFNSGAAHFTPLDDDHTRIVLEMSTDSPRDGGGSADDHEQASMRARGDLQRFKAMIEGQTGESGAWRGEIQDAQVVSGNGAGNSGGGSQTGVGSSRAAASSSGSQGSSPPGTSGSGGTLAARMSGSPRSMTGHSAASWLPQMMSMWEEPFSMMRRMSEEMDRMVEQFVGRPPGFEPSASLSQWTPSVEVVQSGDQLLIAADLPGLRKEEVSVEIRDDKLFIEGQRQHPGAGTEQASRRSTRRFGRFYRMVALPPGIDPDSARATMENGVLQITLPLTSIQNRGRRLEIQHVQEALPSLESPSLSQPAQQAQEPRQAQQTDDQAQDDMQPASPQPAPSQPPSQQSLH